MLISFALQNFKSFRDRAELSLLAKRSDRTVAGALIKSELPGLDADSVLSAIAVYGSNASGKTNLLLGLQAMKVAVLNSQTDWRPTSFIPIDPHLANVQEPTEFEAQIVASGIRYRYGFKCDRKSFLKEWLYSYPKGRERELFVRSTTEIEEAYEIAIEVGSNFSGKKRDHESISRRVRHNSLFLSACAQDNQLESLEVYQWFTLNLIDRAKLDPRSHEVGFTSVLAHDFEKFRGLLQSMMKLTDPSIEEILVKSSDDVDDREKVELSERVKKYSVEFLLSDGGDQIKVDHDRESRGVKRLYGLAAELITALAYGRCIMIDELETSMHAHVASQILALFQNKASNPRGAQLVFTTHETRLLNLQHLRRDQIWFCERTGLNSTLYPLLEFSPRKDENFEAGYLRGRYGAVPQAAIDPSWIAAINATDDAIIDG